MVIVGEFITIFDDPPDRRDVVRRGLDRERQERDGGEQAPNEIFHARDYDVAFVGAKAFCSSMNYM
jgi:hypothetical protein